MLCLCWKETKGFEDTNGSVTLCIGGTYVIGKSIVFNCKIRLMDNLCAFNRNLFALINSLIKWNINKEMYHYIYVIHM